MANIERMTITMPAAMADALRHFVEEGEYASTSEIVREAVRDWSRKRDGERRDLETLRALIKEGMAEPAQPGNEVFARLRARYASPHQEP
ncbi:MAG: ribbon-helix-helix protein, CopG family [Pseudomonadales bacterium]|nr:ribbon-helix-helix protein, CopG family [Pseudomonadales bacterium]